MIDAPMSEIQNFLHLLYDTIKIDMNYLQIKEYNRGDFDDN